MDKTVINGVEQCLKNIGVFTDDDFETKDITEYIEDSLTLIMFIVELEQYFAIEITDDYLSSETLSSFSSIIGIIAQLVEKKSKV